MRVEFVQRENGPERLLSEAEILFDDDGPLAGMKLVGISIWDGGPGGEPHVTFPARSFGVGGERRFFDFLRGAQAGMADVKRVREWILAEWRATSALASGVERTGT